MTIYSLIEIRQRRPPHPCQAIGRFFTVLAAPEFVEGCFGVKDSLAEHLELTHALEPWTPI